MRCPKCRTKIGFVRHKVASESGLSAGRICYMCGYWVQEYPEQGPQTGPRESFSKR